MDLQNQSHLVLLSSPGLGHLIPTIELAKRFLIHHNFKLTIIAITSQTSQAESQILKSATNPSLYTIIQIPSPNIPSDLHLSARLCVTMRHAIPSIKSAITNLTVPPSALIVDIFGTESLILAEELNIPKFVYVASNAWFLSLLVYSPILDKEIKTPYLEHNEPLKIPGCKPVRPVDLVDPMQDRNNLGYIEYLIIANNLSKSDVVLVNTWDELQRRDLKALNGELSGLLKVPVFAIGPLQRMNATFLAEELGVAVKTTASLAKNVVGREEIASLVKKVILEEQNGKSNIIRDKVREIKASAEEALCHGGSSYTTLSYVANIIYKQDSICLSKNIDTRNFIRVI
ncbi:coniferyl-alcohol glucosyltransferase [Trifolium repens]|nr:coniferyl-alcohol glucosyltransferase [Trifolium repens]